MIDFEWNPRTLQLRIFGVASGAIAAGGAAWAYLAIGDPDAALGASAARWVAGAAVVVAVFCGVAVAIAPSLLRPLWLLLSALALPVGYVLSFVALAAIFYGVVTPIGLVFRVLGRDALARRRDPHAETYWVRREPRPDAARYFRQF